MKTIVHINQHKIRSNQKTGEREPVITVKTYKTNQYCKEVEIKGSCKVIYSPDKPLSCGARVWIETQNEVVCLDEIHRPKPEKVQLPLPFGEWKI